MIINVKSLHDANKLIFNIGDEYLSNWISIRDQDYPEIYNIIDTNCKNICKLVFDDITYYQEKHNLLYSFYDEVKLHRNLIHFNKEHAKQIIEFAKNVFNKNEVLNIHCYAGRSRSQAIGYVLNQYFNLYLTNNIDDFLKNIQNNNSKFMGNPDVIKLLNKELFCEG